MNFKEQARASIEQLDEETQAAAQNRVDAILAGPTLIPQQETQTQAPATRKTRSDKGGTHKPKPSAGPDEIVLKLELSEARLIALEMKGFVLAAKVQDQIIQQLQSRIDQLQKSAPK